MNYSYLNLSKNLSHKKNKNKIQTQQKMQTQYNPIITKGVLAVHENALQKLERAHNKVQAEKKKEIAGWDASRLASEMQVYNEYCRSPRNQTKRYRTSHTTDPLMRSDRDQISENMQ